MPIEKLRWMVLASLMAALTAVGAYIHVPIGPVPIVLSTLFVLLSGLLLGSRWGLASMGLYLLVGAIGIPVFAGGKGGFAHFFGPTGGYLFGYVLAAWVAGLISERSRGLLILDTLAQNGDSNVVGKDTCDRHGSLSYRRCCQSFCCYHFS